MIPIRRYKPKSDSPVLSHAYENVEIDLKVFFWNRVARIYPIYLLAAAAALPWLAKNLIAESAATSLLYGLVSIAILFIFGLLLIHAWLPQAFVFWNNSASWSISVEAFFYSLFPFISGILRDFQTRTLWQILFALCVVSSMISVSAISFSNSPESFALFYAMPIFRLPEFVAGIIAYRLLGRVTWTPGLQNLLVITVVIGFLHVMFLGPVLPGYTLSNYIVIPAVISAIVLLYKSESTGSSIFKNSFFVYLGKISYCFYSFQFHVLEGLRVVVPVESIGVLPWALVATLLLLGISALAYHFVEEPARIWIRNQRMTQPILGVSVQ